MRLHYFARCALCQLLVVSYTYELSSCRLKGTKLDKSPEAVARRAAAKQLKVDKVARGSVRRHFLARTWTSARRQACIPHCLVCESCANLPRMW